MRKIDIEGMDSRMGPADAIHPLTDALGTTDVALNHYELAPGDSMAYGYHAHSTQEEVFVPIAGSVTFETSEGDVRVETGEVIRFGPGEFQRSRNDGDERAVVLAIGAPVGEDETEILRECAECGGRTPQSLSMAEDRSAIIASCEECGAETGRFT